MKKFNLINIFSVLLVLCSLDLYAQTSECNEKYKRQILFISDSHGLGPFGTAFDTSLRTVESAYITSINIGGTDPWQYLNPHVRWMSPRGFIDQGETGTTPKARREANFAKIQTPFLSTLLAKYNCFKGQKLAFILLGSNHQHDEWGLNFLATNTATFAALLKKNSFQVFWIGPPQMRRWTLKGDQYYVEVKESLQKGLKNQGDWFESYDITHYPEGGDGVHYLDSGKHREVATKWAQAVFLRYVIPFASTAFHAP